MDRVDITQAKTHTKKLLFSVAELADMVNDIGKSISNYKVAEMVFRLHRPLRQFQSQLHMLSNDFNHTFEQIEDPAFPAFEDWEDCDRTALATELNKLEKLFYTVNSEVKLVGCVDNTHALSIRASWRVLNDFYDVLKGNPRPEYL